MEDPQFWQLVAAHMNGSDEAEIRSRLSLMLHLDSDQLTIPDLIENLACKLDENCTGIETLVGANQESLQTTIYVLNTFYLPCVLFLGIFGNILSCTVFFVSGLRPLVPVYFLLYICVADLAFLFGLFTVWLERFGLVIRTLEGVCQFTIYVDYVSTYLPVWYLTALSIERYFSICKRKACSKGIGKLIIYLLGVMAGVVHLYLTWSSGVVNGYEGNLCSPLPEFVPIITVMSKIETLVGLMLPYGLACLLNIMLCRNIWKPRRDGRLSQSHMDETGRDAMPTHQIPSSQIRASKICAVYCFVSVILTVPCHGMRLRALFIPTSTKALIRFSRNDFLWQELFQHLFYSKPVLNFFSLFFISAGFRRILKSLLLKCTCKSNCLPYSSRHKVLQTSIQMDCYQVVQ